MALDVPAIQRHLARLEELAPDDVRWWRAGPKWTTARLRRFEAAHFELPEDYRTWLAEIGDGGLLLQREDYGSWKTYGGMLPLADRTRGELAAAALPFRITRDCKAREPVSGVLHIGVREGTDPRYLVVTGKRAGEIWERSFYTDWFYRQGTFSDLVDAWMAQSRRVTEAWARPRDPAALAELAPEARFKQLLGPVPAAMEFIPWLRLGPEVFVEAFRQLPREAHHNAHFALVGAIATYVEPLAASTALAGAAARALLGVAEERYRPRTEIEHALVALFDTEQPDLSSSNVARLIARLSEVTGRTPDRDAASGPALWLQTALVKAGRIDEALALFLVQPYTREGDWVALARALVERQRTPEAFAALDTLAIRRGNGRHLIDHEIACAWMQLELGDRSAAIATLERLCAETANAWAEPWLARVRGGTEGPMPLFIPSCSEDSVASSFVGTSNFELVALLYGVAGDGAHMVDATIRALSVDAVRRHRREYTNHLAHLRMGHALLGKIENAPRLVVDYGLASTSRATLADAILARTGKLGITVRRS